MKRNQEHRRSDTQRYLESGTIQPPELVSRRGVLFGLLGGAGVISTRHMIGAPEPVQSTCTLDPDLASLVQEEQLNNTNQALVILPGKGVVATFGNSVYQFDSATKMFTLCRSGNVILKGTAAIHTEDSKDILIEELERVGTTVGARSIRLFHTFEVIDTFKVQISLDAGIPGQNSTFWFSTIYDARTRAFPNGFMVKGDAPFFDFSPLRTLGDLIRARFDGLFLFGPSQPPIVGIVSPEECDRITKDWKAVCELSVESGVYDNSCGILAVSSLRCQMTVIPRFLNPRNS